MKTKNLLLTVGVATLAAISINVSAADPLLSPRAAANQVKHAAGTYSDMDTVHAKSDVAISPRAADARINTVAGLDNDVNAALICTRTMTGSPKIVQACAERPGMPACKTVTVAPLK